MARLRAINGSEDDQDSFGAALGREADLNGGAGSGGGQTYGEGQTTPWGYAVPSGYAVNVTQSRSGETPRERQQTSALDPLGHQPAPNVQMRAPSADNGEHDNSVHQGAQATPVRPRTPTPMAGSTSTVQSGGASTEGPRSFTPMGSPDVGSMATPTSNGLFGSMGGLKGGGLGLPLDPMSNQVSTSISDLIQNLLKPRWY